MRARDIRQQRRDAEELKYALGFAPVDEDDDGEPWEEQEQEGDDDATSN